MRAIRTCVFLLCVLAGTVAQAKDFVSSDNQPADGPGAQAVTYMDRLLRERTDGRLMIGMQGSGSRKSEHFMVGELRTGQIDLARLNVSTFHNSVPAMIIPSLPYLFRSGAQAQRVLDGPIGEDLLASLDKEGLVGLCFYDTGTRSMYSGKKAIRTAADMKGLSMRVQESSAWLAMMRALGAIAKPIPFNQVHAALAGQIVDAAENSIVTYVSSRDYQVAKIYSMTEHSASPSVLVFSKKTWSTLPPEDQAIIRLAARDSVPYFRKLWREQSEIARTSILAAGGQIVTDVDRKSFQDTLEPLYPTLVPDRRLQRLVQRIRAAE